MDIQVFQEKEVWIQTIVNEMATYINAVDKPITLGLSGGKTPYSIYEALSRNIEDPTKLHVYIADERYVPFDHPDSNYGMILASFIGSHKETIGSFHFIDTRLSIQEAIDQYSDELKQISDGSLDMLFLGIGPDGHILSLFPHTEQVLDKVHDVVHSTTDRFVVHDRITMTSRFVLNAKRIMLVASGNDKYSVIEDLKAGVKSVEESPVMMLRDHPHLQIFYLHQGENRE